MLRKLTVSPTYSRRSRISATDSENNELYKIEYTFSGDLLTAVTEYGKEGEAFVQGASTAYTYSAASNRTIAETTILADDEGAENEIIKTVYTFNDNGELLSKYAYTEDSGNVGANGNASGINPYMSDDGTNVICNINNLLSNHSFETDWGWYKDTSSDSSFVWSYADGSQAKYGNREVGLHSVNNTAVSAESGIYQQTDILSAGEYTFSVYMRALPIDDNDMDGYIRVSDTSGNVLAVSEHIDKNDTEYIRLTAPFTLENETAVKAEIRFNGYGSVYADAAQLEKNPFANDYNMLENGNFEKDTSDWWGPSAGYSADTCFSSTRSLKIAGNIMGYTEAYQTVKCKVEKDIRETFTLSGWAKAYAIPQGDSGDAFAPTFRLRAEVRYHNIGDQNFASENFYADFSPCTDEWQFASIEFAKSHYGVIEDIRIYCEYAYNFGNAYFDNLKLVRNSIETGLTAEDFSNNETSDSDSTNTSADSDTVNEETAPEFEEVNFFGNLRTETTFKDGEFGTIYRSFGYDSSSNNLISETDARGNFTNYTVDSETSRNEVVTDRLGNKTVYEYDAEGKTTRVTSKKANNTVIADVAYAYDEFDNLTEITRGDGMKYSLNYNVFHELKSIGIDGMKDSNNNPINLVNYTYKNGNGRLKEISYANGDRMTATYNSLGQLIAEKWYNVSNTLTAHCKYVYDGQGNIVRSIDITALKEYNYIYENGQIARVAEYDITLGDGEIITSKTLVNAIKYYYDNEGSLIKKRVSPANAEEQVFYFEKDENDSTVLKFELGGKAVTCHSKTDSFGRKEFEEVQFSTGFASRRFDYLTGQVTDEHKTNNKLKSTPTTQLVSRITLSDGRTLDYEYDAEERITKVTDSVSGVTEYTYDELGQLLTETVNGTVKNTMTYDSYGNILSKNGVSYIYGDSVWKDKLTGVGNKTITYDAQGNPVNYLGKTLVWEKGRQLKSINNDAYTFTYNANGIRTSKYIKTLNSTHKYTLDGTKILREDWTEYVGQNNSIYFYIIPLYDNEDNVIGINFCGSIYYFIKNLQGDVIEIVSGYNGNTVAKYTYDAWGKCTIDSDSMESYIAYRNPFRYRSYYYDHDTDLYYLQSRYYDPNTGRFLNGDEVEVVITEQNIFTHNLFTYCLNNPIFYSDPTGRWISFRKAYYNFRKSKAYSNYTYNRHYDNFKSYINGQGIGMISRLKFGFFRMSYNGCEVIAIYNALVLKNRRIPISDIALEMEINGASKLFGIFGCNPYYISKYLTAHNIKFDMTIKISQLNKYKKNNGVYIISFWNKKTVLSGLHTVAVKYTKGRYYVYNRFGDVNYICIYNSFERIFKEGQFIVGYYIR